MTALARKRLMQAAMDAEPVELAMFELASDGRVIATYRDETMQRYIEDTGICIATAARLTPADGRTFFDALALAFSRSSFVYVVDE